MCAGCGEPSATERGGGVADLLSIDTSRGVAEGRVGGDGVALAIGGDGGDVPEPPVTQFGVGRG